jgi:hypothetical protein
MKTPLDFETLYGSKNLLQEETGYFGRISIDRLAGTEMDLPFRTRSPE